MSEESHCPDCGGPLQGRQDGPSSCPRCLLELGLVGDTTRDTTAAGAAAEPRPSHAGARQVGPYRLLEVLGEGGFGVVYLAEQREPLQRRVALKLIKLGMDSREVIARFEAEQHALALMSHPNIARVLDAGATERGTPYFVMEHVPGLPITDHADRNRLGIEARLRLFIQVCHAVQHAHQKGVVHRDLKPSNILVAVEDGEARPKVIDFGIAKALDHRRTGASLFTQRGALIGTPAYMSPEQASLQGADVDSTTDVYSLGVLLYELLCGSLPFETERLHGAALDEMLRIIREEDPPSLASRVSIADAVRSELARRRRTDGRRLAKELSGDLEWITRRALEKDRTQRYPSATELAADVERHLTNEPVMAGPPSAAYRLGKLARKHRRAVAFVGCVAVALLLGLVASTMAWRQAGRERARAESERQRALEGRKAAEASAVRARVAGLLAAASEARSGGRPESALRLAGRAAELETSPRTDQALRDALGDTRAVGFVPEPRAGLVQLSHGGDEALVVDERGAALWSRDGQRLVRLEGARAVRLSPAGRLVAWAPADASWSGQPRVFVSRAALPRTTEPWALSRDGLRLAAQAEGGGLRIWNAETGESVSLASLDTTVHDLEFSRDGALLSAALADGSVRVWRSDGEPLATLRGHEAAVMRIGFTPDGTHLISVGADWTVRTWSLVEGRERARFPLSEERPPMPEAVLRMPRLSDLAIGEGLVMTWVAKRRDNPRVDVRDLDGALVTSLPGDAAPSAGGLHVAPGDGLLVVATADQLVRAFDRQGRESWRRALATAARSLAFSDDGRRLAVADGEGVRVFELAGEEPRAIAWAGPRLGRAAFAGATDSVLTWTSGFNRIDLWSPLGRRLAAWDRSGFLGPRGAGFLTEGPESAPQLWDSAGRLVATLDMPALGCRAAAFDGRGERVLSLAEDGVLRLHDASGRLVGQLEAGRIQPLRDGVALSPSGTRAVVLGAASGLLWEPATGALVEFEHGLGGLARAEFSPDGAGFLVTGHPFRGSSRLYDARAEARADIPCPAAAFSPDGRWLASWCPGGAHPTELHSLLDGSRRELLNEAVDRVVWSPDATKLVACAGPRAVLWSVASGSVVELKGHAADVTSAAFSSDGRRVLTGSEDDTARLWTVEGELSAVLRGHGSDVEEVAFSFDGSRLLTRSSDGTALLWTASSAQVRRLALRRLEVLPGFGPSELAAHEDLLRETDTKDERGSERAEERE